MRVFTILLCLTLSLPAMAARELEWDDLVPEGYEPQEVYGALFDEIYGDKEPDDIEDGGDKGERMMDAIDKAWREAPLKQSLDNTVVRLPGYGVPLDGDEEYVREFLLVPYFGACIHTPPPPRNQIILVKMEGRGVPLDLAVGAMWLEGTLKVSSQDTEYGTAGYVLEGQSAEPFTGYPQ
ncbi:MAG: DUF3299 domain-containing protein [Pseudomonadota bacterium]|nr:DUF3299 domain-containing protein [Pseudomonadota bacterium]MEE3322160.1 DUF3299 domain-containing protein [Pseudomonadota bacterium]